MSDNSKCKNKQTKNKHRIKVALQPKTFVIKSSDQTIQQPDKRTQSQKMALSRTLKGGKEDVQGPGGLDSVWKTMAFKNVCDYYMGRSNTFWNGDVNSGLRYLQQQELVGTWVCG